MNDSLFLTDRKCKPCEGGTKPLGELEARGLLKEVPGWELVENREIRRRFTFKSFRQAQAWLNKMADLAEDEGHHPDVTWNYSRILITLTTHAIGGLSENDFILAAKIDRL
ncbi:MAG TPA: 4a-hydroxytetrahydrobiopterin dehydratase [archaeon]|nr:4a-hydroxytetrahydrobiopterin dehydratase [archaeon]